MAAGAEMPPEANPAGAPSGSVAVSVVIASLDESSNIAACIDSVRWADEIIVADHGSIDNTCEQARAAGASVMSSAGERTIGAARNLAIATARNHWILVVDADERGTSELEQAVRDVVSQPRSAAYRIPRRNFFLGGEIRHGGWNADRPVRLFDSALRYDDSRVHEHVVTRGEPATLGASLLHYPYASLDIYFDKFVRYSKWWAEDQARKGRKSSIAAIALKPPARFVSMYLFRMGFMDGARGAALAALAAASVCAKYVRLWALECES